MNESRSKIFIAFAGGVLAGIFLWGFNWMVDTDRSIVKLKNNLEAHLEQNQQWNDRILVLEQKIHDLEVSR